MNAINKTDLEFIQFFEFFPWPVILVDEEGYVTFRSLGAGTRAATLTAEPNQLLSTAFPEYFSLLKGEPPWLTSQEIDVTRNTNKGAISEKLWLRRLAKGSYIVVQDQTKLYHLEYGNAQTARLATLGFMLAGVCHEISNPLTAIHSMVQILRSGRGVSTDALEKGLENISSNVKRVLDVSRKLNEFSRKGENKRVLVQIDIIVEEALAFAKQDPSFIKIEVEHQADPDAWILGNISELRQVFLNILINALHAMQGHGRIALRTSHTLRHAEIRIIDSGPGIALEHLPRLFEPFFTTKPSGSGTGLGLAISNEIVLEHDGIISAENTANKGACFLIQLPLYRG